jgi:hypothetical protein
MEHKIISSAFARAGASNAVGTAFMGQQPHNMSYYHLKFTCNFLSRQVSPDAAEDLSKPPRQNKSNNNLDIRIAAAQYRRRITDLMIELKWEDKDPLDCITFETNKFLEAAITGTPLGVTTYHCTVCVREKQPETRITTGCSVLLTCGCPPSLCQECALRSVARDPLTFLSGITCPTCNHCEKKAFGGTCTK